MNADDSIGINSTATSFTFLLLITLAVRAKIQQRWQTKTSLGESVPGRTRNRENGLESAGTQ